MIPIRLLLSQHQTHDRSENLLEQKMGDVKIDTCGSRIHCRAFFFFTGDFIKCSLKKFFFAPECMDITVCVCVFNKAQRIVREKECSPFN